MKKQFILLLYLLFIFHSIEAKETSEACLQALLTIEPQNQIKPGIPLQLKAKIKNIGKKISHAGNLFIRYAFLEPFHNHEESVLFKTEKLPLPSLKPNEEIELAFQTKHSLPSVFDYIRHDWPMRQYEAIVNIEGQEELIGRTALSISAHYYQGPIHHIPKEVRGSAP